jgi:hypothetical protein
MHMKKPIYPALIAMSMVVSTSLAIAQSKMDRIKSCKNKMIADLVQKSRSDIQPIAFGAHCEPGNIQGFPPHCGGMENNETPARIVPGKGFRIIPGSVQLLDNGSNTPSRTGIGLTSQSESEATARAWCNGHGCGGEGAIDARGLLKARQEWVPTEKNINDAFESCVEAEIEK